MNPPKQAKIWRYDRPDSSVSVVAARHDVTDEFLFLGCRNYWFSFDVKLDFDGSGIDAGAVPKVVPMCR